MRIGFFCSRRERCLEFANHFAAGLAIADDVCSTRPVLKAHGDGEDVVDGEIIPDIDVAVIYAVLHKKAFATMRKANIPIVYIDKAYNRDWNYRRISVGYHQPTHYLGYWNKREDRRLSFGWKPKPWRKSNSKAHILLAWSDDRDHEWRGWISPEEHVLPVVEYLQARTDRPILYRRKPNQPPKKMLTGVYMSMSARSLAEDLAYCHVLITPGTSTCLQALLAGIPTIVMDDAIVRNISSLGLCQFEQPYLAPEEDRLQLLNDLAYCQYHVDEYESGVAWCNIRPLVVKHMEELNDKTK